MRPPPEMLDTYVLPGYPVEQGKRTGGRRMQSLALALSCAAFAAQGSIHEVVAPDLLTSSWPGKPEVHLRNMRGRQVILILYHTAC